MSSFTEYLLWHQNGDKKMENGDIEKFIFLCNL